jgi:selenide,water dikinase
MAEADDAAVVVLPSGERLGLSVDAFTAFCDDPFVVGRVAAVNAVNDLFVKGIEPRWAMVTVAVPRESGVLEEVMAGARSALDEMGVTLVGGHTLRAAELSVGLAVTGIAYAGSPAATRPGDALVLTRGLGSGVLLRAGALGRARGAWSQQAVRWMSRSHRAAAAVLREHGAGAATDITGFGLYGHLATLLARVGGLGADVCVADLPLYPGAGALFLQGVRSTFHAQNARSVAVSGPGASHALAEIGYDPQTAGPLLFAVSSGRVQDVIAALALAGEPARVIGAVREAPGIRLV